MKITLTKLFEKEKKEKSWIKSIEGNVFSTSAYVLWLERKVKERL